MSLYLSHMRLFLYLRAITVTYARYLMSKKTPIRTLLRKTCINVIKVFACISTRLECAATLFNDLCFEFFILLHWLCCKFMEAGISIILSFLLLATILISRFQVRMWLQIILFAKKKKNLQAFSYCLSTAAYGYGEKVNQSR